MLSMVTVDTYAACVTELKNFRKKRDHALVIDGQALAVCVHGLLFCGALTDRSA